MGGSRTNLLPLLHGVFQDEADEVEVGKSRLTQDVLPRKGKAKQFWKGRAYHRGVMDLEKPPLEAALQSLLDQGLHWRLERSEEEGLMRIHGKTVRVVLESLRPYREEIWALTTPLLGQEAVWRTVKQEVERIKRKGGKVRVHLEPVFGLPLALRVPGEGAVDQVGGMLGYPAFFTFVLETQEEVLGWRSPYWWGELAEENQLKQAYPDLVEEVLRARKKGSAKVNLFGVQRTLSPGELVAYRLYGRKAV